LEPEDPLEDLERRTAERCHQSHLNIWRRVDRQGHRLELGIEPERIHQRQDVGDVVGVPVGEDQRVELAVVHLLLETRERPVPSVEPHLRVVGGEQETRTRTAGPRIGGTGPQHGDLHPAHPSGC
jgi:hypothetical protein